MKGDIAVLLYGIFKYYPSHKISMPRYVIQRKELISTEETMDIINKLADPKDKSMVAMFFLFGCRPAELAECVRNDFNISDVEDKLWVNMTNKKKRKNKSELIISTRWIWADMKDPLVTYILNWIEDKDMEETLWDYGRTPKSRNKSIDRRLKSVNPNVCAYVFRKSKATRLKNAGNNDGTVVHWFGWADSRPLQAYDVGTKKSTENIVQDRSDEIEKGE